MHHFQYQDGELYCEEVPLRKIAEKVGTPTYVYSTATLTRHYYAFTEPFKEIKPVICFSVKALSNIAILRLFANFGSGFDIVSGGELYRVEKAGGDTSRVVFTGPAKTEGELVYALSKDILLFNVESEPEMELLDQIAKRQGKKARVALRVNPDINPETHPHISTGLSENKFGIEANKALELYQNWKKYHSLELIGIDCHIGSQLVRLRPIVEALTSLIELVVRLKNLGLEIKYLDLGGGLGIVYRDEEPPLPKEYAKAIIAVSKKIDCSLILEPGRVLVGNAGILLLKALYLKQTSAKKFIIADAGMNALIRPSLYGAYHEVLPVIQKTPQKNNIADLVGPICESADFLAKDRPFPELKPNELLAVMSAGAYGFVMSSNYNSQPRPAEVLVSGKEFYVIREREGYEQLITGEIIPDFLIKNKR